MTHSLRMAGTILALGLAALCHAADLTAPSIGDAFAKVQREGQPYPAFYDYYITPHAIVENGQVFTAHQDGEGRPIAMVYDIGEKSWQGPVRVSDFGLGADTHGNPSICLDREGRIHLFYGCHGKGDPLLHAVSANPYDISEWRELDSPVTGVTYPETARLADGRMVLLYRAGGHMEPWSLQESTDDGQTWSGPERIIEMRLDPPDPKAAAYVTFMPGPDHQTLHFFFVHKDDNPTRVEPHPWRPLKYPGLHEAVYRYGVYYIRREPDGSWTGADGSRLKLPLSKAAADTHARVFDSGDLFVRHQRIVVDERNRAYLRFTTGVDDWKNNKIIVPHRTHYAAFEKDNWSVWRNTPNTWPAAVRRQLKTPGPAAFGGEFPQPWFIYHERGTAEDPTATYVWLGHAETGYAPRQGGPADAP